MNKAINFEDKFSKFSEQWKPKVVAEMNNYQFKLTRIQGEFVWHDHKETDETFIVIDGEMRIEFRDKTIYLKTGEMCVVPKGKEHRPVAENECKIMVIEPSGVINTGDTESDMKAENNIWI